MKRRLLNLVTSASLLSCAVMGASWAASYRRPHSLPLYRSGREWRVVSHAGTVFPMESEIFPRAGLLEVLRLRLLPGRRGPARRSCGRRSSRCGSVTLLFGLGGAPGVQWVLRRCRWRRAGA